MDKQHTSRREHRIQMLLTALAFGCLLGFARMFAEGSPGFEATHGEAADMLSALCSGSRFVVLVVLTVFGCMRKFPITRMTVVGSGLLMAVASVFLSLKTNFALTAVMAVLGGAASAVAMFALVMLLSAKPLSEIVTVSLFGLVVGGAVIGMLFALDHLPGSIVLAVAGFLSPLFITLLDPHFDCCEDRGEFSREEFRRFPWPSATLTAVAGILGSVLYGVAVSLGWYTSGQANYMVMGIITLVAIAAVSILIMKDAQWTRIIWVIPMAQLLITLGLMCTSGPTISPIGMGALLSSVMVFHFSRWMIFPAFVSTSMLPRVFLNGVFLIATSSFFNVGLGKAAASLLPVSMQTPSSVACLAALLVVLLFTIGFIVGHGRRSRIYSAELDDLAEAQYGEPSTRPSAVQQADAVPISVDETELPETQNVENISDSSADGEAQPTPDVKDSAEAPIMSLEEICATLAEEFGLTPREQQIAELTARGHSSTYIADELFISSSTVRFHQQNLYRKLNVHSKQELIVLVDSRSAKPINSVG